MEWNDTGILTHKSIMAEAGHILHFMTENHGYVSAFSSKKKPIAVMELGMRAHLRWYARVPNQMGRWQQIEVICPYGSLLLGNMPALWIIQTLCFLYRYTQNEHEPVSSLYCALHNMLSLLLTEEKWCRAYVDLELLMLNETGFGLDWSRCALTGQTGTLSHFSPITGRAVCYEAALPYIDKLIAVPSALYREGEIRVADCLEILTVTGFFLERHLLTPRKQSLPISRFSLIQWLSNQDK
jgi:DNA repair protein RecO (recombination protein O)